VRGPNWVGDLVMSTPGLRALRAHFPAARITLQVREGHEALLRGAECCDAIIPVASYHAGVRALLHEARSMARAQRFDLGVCIPDSYSSALLMRLAGVRNIVGYRRGVRGWLLHHEVSPPAEWRRDRLVSRERFVLGLMEAIGCESRGTELELGVTDAEEEALRSTLAQCGIGGDARPWVGLAPGASFGPSKLWPVESYAQVGDALSRQGACVLLIGSAAESALTGAVREAMRERAWDLAGALDVGTLKALVRQLSLLVCNDAGARHIAVAFGVPCLVFFGPTSLAKTNVNLENVHVLEIDVACRPCYLRECPIDHPCMREIRPDGVISLACEVLGAAPRNARPPAVVEEPT
jgi:heptosyltransferase-2